MNVIKKRVSTLSTQDRDTSDIPKNLITKVYRRIHAVGGYSDFPAWFKELVSNLSPRPTSTEAVFNLIAGHFALPRHVDMASLYRAYKCDDKRMHWLNAIVNKLGLPPERRKLTYPLNVEPSSSQKPKASRPPEKRVKRQSESNSSPRESIDLTLMTVSSDSESSSPDVSSADVAVPLASASPDPFAGLVPPSQLITAPMPPASEPQLPPSPLQLLRSPVTLL